MTAATQQSLFVADVDESALSENERAVLRRLDRYGKIATGEAGRIIYRNRGQNPNLVKSEWLRSAGYELLNRLRGRGLVKRRRDRLWGRV
jgi:hypothetical protein